jgi:thermostable 8-oxoguanine DNA glycosylase
MKLEWWFDEEDVQGVRELVEGMSDDFLVQGRIARNITREKAVDLTPEAIWHALCACRLTSQQRSGPDAPVIVFLLRKPFPLALHLLHNELQAEEFIRSALVQAGGIRFTNQIAKDLNRIFQELEAGGWSSLVDLLRGLREGPGKDQERSAAGWIQRYPGFGMKQSRNLLQMLGLTRYEIPLDSRIARWLKGNGFAFPLDAGLLGTPSYYLLVMDCLQDLCEQAGVYPCAFDAAVFASFDGGGWNETNFIW